MRRRERAGPDEERTDRWPAVTVSLRHAIDFGGSNIAAHATCGTSAVRCSFGSETKDTTTFPASVAGEPTQRRYGVRRLRPRSARPVRSPARLRRGRRTPLRGRAQHRRGLQMIQRPVVATHRSCNRTFACRRPSSSSAWSYRARTRPSPRRTSMRSFELRFGLILRLQRRLLDDRVAAVHLQQRVRSRERKTNTVPMTATPDGSTSRSSGTTRAFGTGDDPISSDIRAFAWHESLRDEAPVRVRESATRPRIDRAPTNCVVVGSSTTPVADSGPSGGGPTVGVSTTSAPAAEFTRGPVRRAAAPTRRATLEAAKTRDHPTARTSACARAFVTIRRGCRRAASRRERTTVASSAALAASVADA